MAEAKLPIGAPVDGDGTTRADVEQRWVALLDGRLTREQVHAWTMPRLEDAHWSSPDPMVSLGVTYLHGFDLASDTTSPSLLHHGSPGVYRKTLTEIRADLDHWRHECADHDADPAAWRSRRLALARAIGGFEQAYRTWREAPFPRARGPRPVIDRDLDDLRGDLALVDAGVAETVIPFAERRVIDLPKIDLVGELTRLRERALRLQPRHFTEAELGAHARTYIDLLIDVYEKFLVASELVNS